MFTEQPQCTVGTGVKVELPMVLPCIDCEWPVLNNQLTTSLPERESDLPKVMQLVCVKIRTKIHVYKLLTCAKVCVALNLCVKKF